MYLVAENTESCKALLPLYAITLGTDFLQPPVRRLQGAPFHHIFFIEKGTARFTTAEGSVTLGVGSVLFLPKGLPVAYEGVDEELRTGWVTFDGACAENMLTYFNATRLSYQENAALRELHRACIRSAEKKVAPEALSKLCYDLVITYFLSLREEGQSEKLSAAKAYMERYFDTDLSVGEVARSVDVSESLLYRLFRAEGSTPVEYLRTLRLSHAKRLLLEFPKMPVAEIATACGFADSAYFCKVFRDREHMTPRSYRSMYMPWPRST